MCIIVGQEAEDYLAVTIAATQIFARLESKRQFLVYSMRFGAAGDAAMILPLPIQQSCGEDAIDFISLQHYPNFFDDLADSFLPEPQYAEFELGSSAADSGSHLQVHAVGDFVASYVPSIADFSRLDPRFRLPEHLWRALPRYRDWGFAVFQLSATTQALSEWLPSVQIHPMALSFPSRFPDQLYFPTVHIHDGTWHDHADFDHQLYSQFGQAPAEVEASLGPLGQTMQTDTAGIVLPGQGGFRQRIQGRHGNQDVWYGASPSLPAAA